MSKKLSHEILTGLSAVVVILMVVFGAQEVFAEGDIECEYLSGNNVNYNDYLTWSKPVSSYLTSVDDGYMRVQGDIYGSSVTIVYYDKDFKPLSRKVLPEELPIFGGFYESADNYYIVTGQTNQDENDNIEVYRLTKYDKNWNRLDSCGLYGANTCVPFDAGSCRMAMSGKYMIVRTCHEMYKSSDGLNHQANVTIEIDTSMMKITDSYTVIMNERAGYVSHSFNQFVKIENNHIVALDHGDANPRAFDLMIYPTDISSGSFSTYNVAYYRVMDFPAADESHHYNITGASAGALEISSSSYLVAGNSNSKTSKNIGNKTRNIFVISMDKSSRGITTNWLTDYAEGETTVSTPHMTKISSDRFMVLWTRGDKLCYVLVNGRGEAVSEIYEKDGELSDCAPVVIDGAVTWYTWNYDDEALYRVPVDDPDNMTITERHFGHDFRLIKASSGNADVVCRKCGNEYKAKVPDDFTVFWRDPKDEDEYTESSLPPSIEIGESLIYNIWPKSSGESQDIELNEFVVEAEDPDSCVIDAENDEIKFLKGGRINIIVYPKYNPDVKQTIEITVKKDLEGVELVLGTDTVTVNTGVGMEAVPDGGRGKVTYTFYAEKEGIGTREISSGYSQNIWWFPYAAGEWKLYVTATDDFDGRIVTSSKVTLNVKEAPKDESSPWDDETGWDDGTDGNSNEDGSGTGDNEDGYDYGEDNTGSDEWSDWKYIIPDYPDDPWDDGSGGSGSSGNGGAFRPGASIKEVERAIAGMTSDGDPAGSKFAPLMLSSKKQKKSSIKLSWKGVSRASKYIIYANKCGKKNKLTKLATVGASKKSYNVKRAAGKKLKKGKYYKFIVIAADSADKVVTSSKIIHVATKGGKVGNHKKIKVKKSVIRKAKKLKKGKTLSIRAKAVPASRKLKVKKHVAVRYESSNPRIATVNKKGKVKALKKGKVTIYCYAQNGVGKAVKMTVK